MCRADDWPSASSAELHQRPVVSVLAHYAAIWIQLNWSINSLKPKSGLIKGLITPEDPLSVLDYALSILPSLAITRLNNKYEYLLNIDLIIFIPKLTLWKGNKYKAYIEPSNGPHRRSTFLVSNLPIKDSKPFEAHLRRTKNNNYIFTTGCRILCTKHLFIVSERDCAEHPARSSGRKQTRFWG